MERIPFLVLWIIFSLQRITVTGIPLGSFYSFGVGAGDSSLGPNDDGSSPTITLSESFPFFDEDHSTIFVSSNIMLLQILLYSLCPNTRIILVNQKISYAVYYSNSSSRLLQLKCGLPYYVQNTVRIAIPLFTYILVRAISTSAADDTNNAWRPTIVTGGQHQTSGDRHEQKKSVVSRW